MADFENRSAAAIWAVSTGSAESGRSQAGMGQISTHRRAVRARFPLPDTALIAAQIAASPGIDRVRALTDGFAAATPETIAAILDEAVKFAETHLAPLNDAGDAQGCRIEQGRVRTATGHREAWTAFVEAGWGTLDAPGAHGGQDLPLALAAAVQEIFDRACPAFGMLPVPQRSATRLIAAHGNPAMQAEWLPRLVSGEWGATICISEAEAGSDAGRIRTRAEPNADGSWSITGEKIWISFGDHDLTPRIGHCLLARTPGAPPGGAGLSLFLVPDTITGDARNAIAVRRIEHKLGLHASPTCALGFDGATGWMIGTESRGLAQMFVMITNMRLSVGIQGLGIAAGCADLALAYAAERRQGGSDERPVPIIEHADVRRQLFEMVARVETMRGLALALANQAEFAAHETDEDARADAAALVQWLLPIVKTTGGEVAFDVASGAIQVLGGAGYTREWPAEQALRDARVLTIFEGTTGIQALDLLHRRLLRGDRRGYSVFLREARAAAAPVGSRQFDSCLDAFAAAADALCAMAKADTDAAATDFLHLAALAACGWIAARLAVGAGDDSATRRLRAAAGYRLANIGDQAQALRARIMNAASSLEGFADVCPG